MKKIKEFFKNEANKNALLSVWYNVITFIIPIPIFYWATGELLLNSLQEKTQAWTLLLFYFAGLSKAISNTVSDHYSKSKFSSLNPFWWDKSISWQNKYSDLNKLSRKKFLWVIPVPVLFTDAWHLFQSLMITFAVLGAIFYSPFNFNFNPSWLNYIANFILVRTMFGLGFYGAYNWYLIKPENR